MREKIYKKDSIISARPRPETERIRTYFLTGLVKKFSPHRKVTRVANERDINMEYVIEHFGRAHVGKHK